VQLLHFFKNTVSLTNWHFVVTDTNHQTDIPTLLDSWVTKRMKET